MGVTYTYMAIVGSDKLYCTYWIGRAPICEYKNFCCFGHSFGPNIEENGGSELQKFILLIAITLGVDYRRQVVHVQPRSLCYGR